MLNVAINYQANRYIDVERGRIYVESAKGSLFYSEVFKEGAKTTILDLIKKGLDIKAYCLVMKYNEACATGHTEDAGNRVVGGSFFRNKYAEDISTSCLYDQQSYDDYNDCNNFLAGLFSTDYIDHPS